MATRILARKPTRASYDMIGDNAKFIVLYTFSRSTHSKATLPVAGLTCSPNSWRSPQPLPEAHDVPSLHSAPPDIHTESPGFPTLSATDCSLSSPNPVSI
ncbi:hypothetical protein CONPUDRAFT_133704 [Coniophora puteana RWD-64-598 SS2]|uniref:Uncharacterized protein n=1 Tax=Coniophora puteana (strain RWD-64-598) TaxID=741705 RepID=A0A5M3N4E3_CONPW|nr:uncharacterized protein CONPUDRAFT_133704 [Coniophora puteana RWD-64-598 SS2]EIW86178.1 hypothetical protein CONPUDRAFT_133704 [Coniophora puteana RWD-64-598 SS2]